MITILNSLKVFLSWLAAVKQEVKSNYISNETLKNILSESSKR